jgi:xanthine dehydrogenase small subunit
MIKFILNNKLIQTDDPPGTLLLDCIRYGQHLTGTKIGCREGDCGACTVLLGELKGAGLVYQSVTSCLTALGNVHQKHVVTIEGINGEGLNFLQQVICDEGGTQCGFCTPGFIVSMAGFCLSDKAPTYAQALASVDGNICRCTGYKSIERALSKVTELLARNQPADAAPARQTNPLAFAIANNILPAYFNDIPRRLAELSLQPNGVLQSKTGVFLGGGTDLYVQQPEAMVEAGMQFLSAKKDLKGITMEEEAVIIGGAATVSDMLESPIIRRAFPHFDQYARLISSTPIRNIATVAGNFVNASPIGDLSIFFLALDAQLTLTDGGSQRQLPLCKFFKAYKILDRRSEEYIEKISFIPPKKDTLFHFEKVSKRTHLDIASVNTAIQLKMAKDGTVKEAHLSAGGVGPIPARLEAASDLLTGQKPHSTLIQRLIDTAQTEITPISDVRGAAEYKRLLLGQLIKAHFITLFPHLPAHRLADT